MVSYSRHREETILDESERATMQYLIGTAGSCTSSAGPPTDSYSSEVKGDTYSLETREMDDVVTPDFHKLIAAGKIINNPMTVIRYEKCEPLLRVDLNAAWEAYACTPERWIQVYNLKKTGTVTQSIATDCDFLQIPESSRTASDLMDMAITDAWANIGSNDVLAMSSLKEANQTVQGLAYILKKAYKITRAVKKLSLRQLKREISWKEMQEVYMNARYNLRPLAYDASGMMTIINEGPLAPHRQTFRGHAEDIQQVSEESSDLFTTIFTAEYNLKKSKVSSRIIEARAGVLTDVDQGSYARSLGIDRVVETMWDLLPYSFIVDWFANVGPTLSSWTPVAGHRTLASWCTVKITDTQKVYITGLEVEPFTPYSSYRIADQGSTVDPVCYSITTTTKHRFPNYSRPLLPTFKLKLDPLKLLDLVIIGKNIRKNKPYVR